MRRTYERDSLEPTLLCKHTCFVASFGNLIGRIGYEQLPSSQEGDEICIYIRRNLSMAM